MISPELQSKIAHWQQKAVAGTLTMEEQREAVRLIRGDRINAGTAAASSAKKRPAKSAEDLLSELGGLS